MTRARFGLLLGLAALVVAVASFAIGIAVFDSDGPDDPPTGARTGDDATSDTTGTTTATTAPPGDDPAAPGNPTWIVVVSSEGDQARAQAVVDDIADTGLPSGVLRSDDHESLTPGFWVAYVGPYATPAEATTARDSLEGSGVGGAYVRCVGTDEQCPSAPADGDGGEGGGNGGDNGNGGGNGDDDDDD